MDRPSSRSPPRSSSPRRTAFTRPVEEVSSQYRGFLEQPGLDTFDQIMIEHLGIEELYKLYTDENREVFNQPSTLQLLIQRFGFKDYDGKIGSFEDLLRAYDEVYATVRSYSRPAGRSPERILLRACREGNIQAVIKGLKLYPEFRTEALYVRCWDEAAYKTQPTIVWFFFDLLAQVPKFDYSQLSLQTAVGSGDLKILKHLLVLLKDRKDDEAFTKYLDENLVSAFCDAIATNQEEMIEELMKEEGFESRILYVDQKGLDALAEATGKSGQHEKVESVFNLLQILPEEEMNFYDNVLWGAAQKDRLALVEKVHPLTSETGRLGAAKYAIANDSWKVLSYLLRNFEWTTEELVDFISGLIDEKQDKQLEEVLTRLEGKDWVLPFMALISIEYRKEEDFAPLAERLLAHATPEDLRERDLNKLERSAARSGRLIRRQT